jgi:hypothetical protein
MSALSAMDLLQVWERGQRASLPQRALLLLAADPAEPEPQQLPVGLRDQRLLAMRERLFGRGLTCVAPCPGCGERLELPLDTRQFEVPASAVGELVLERAGAQVRFRTVTGEDLVACAAEPDLDTAERRLLERCVLEARLDGQAVAAAELPPDLLEALGTALADADPGAVLEVAVTCPLCGHHWANPFDIASFLWTELQDWALRVLGEVHTLASVYGWTEREILDLGPWRRSLYLQMVGR